MEEDGEVCVRQREGKGEREKDGGARMRPRQTVKRNRHKAHPLASPLTSERYHMKEQEPIATALSESVGSSTPR